MRWNMPLVAVSLLASTSFATDGTDSSPTATELFEQRIMPIFRSDKPSSCVQCHLASVDIKDYILPSHRDTFVALREQGLVNLDAPDESKILTLIRMGDKDRDKGARLIHEKTRKAEFDAFSSWIHACCNDQELRTLKLKESPTVGPDKPLQIVRHARKSRLVDSFARNVFSQRMRCFPCHTPNEIQADNPKHKVAAKRHGELVKKFGLKMNIFGETAEATLDQIIASSRRKIPGRYPMINLEDPAKSLLVLKPTSKLPPKDDSGEFAKPSSKDPVSHMGGLKMHVDDQSYKAFVSWIQDYSNVVGGRYVSVDDLPADNWVPTQRILRLTNVPEAWGELTPVQLFVYGRRAGSDAWSDEPLAFTQGLITPRRMVNGALFLFKDKANGDHVSTDRRPLRPGKYLVKAYVDRTGKIAAAPSCFLDVEDGVGKAEIAAHWNAGFKQAETFSADELK